MEPGISGPAGYVEWTAPLPLRRYVVCSWTGGLRSGGAGSPEPVLPDGCMDIIWDGERLFVAGPDTVPNPTAAEGPFVVGVRFHPGIGPRFLGVPADELRTGGWAWIGCGPMPASSQRSWPRVLLCVTLP